MKHNYFIILLISFSIISTSCTQGKEYSVRGKITNINISKNVIFNKANYKKINLSLSNTETYKTKIKQLIVLIPEDNRDSESFPIDSNEILKEFPIGAEIKTTCTRYLFNYYVIINLIQEHIITQWP